MTKPSNPFVQPKTWLHEVMTKAPVYAGAVSGPRFSKYEQPPFVEGTRIEAARTLRIEINKVFDVDDAKATLQMAQWSLRAYRIALGAAERRPDSPDWFLRDCRFSVARYEHRVCEALDRLWLAQENANV